MKNGKAEESYNNYSRYLKDLYGELTYRVAVDAGFSCPNRGSDRRSGGCTYCDEYGSRAAYQRDGIVIDSRLGLEERTRAVQLQVENGISFLQKRYGTKSFIIYFQAFSSTFAPADELKTIYDAGLAVYPFRELIVSTRPDCVNPDVAALLGGYVRRGLPVWVELGLQSACDATLLRINRGHTAACFESTLNILRQQGIKVAAHVIFGLPGEGREEMMQTIEFLSSLKVDGIKIHDLHIPRATPLFEEFLSGELALPCEDRHLRYVVDALERLPEQTVVMRLTCDTPDSTRALPLHPPSKARFVQRVKDELLRRGSVQGCVSSQAPPRPTGYARKE